MTLNNVLKAIEALDAIRGSCSAVPDPAIRKEKISHCMIIAEGICVPNVRFIQKFSNTLCLSIKTLLILCDDVEADVRMVADECLNKIIRAMADSYIAKVQLVLYNEIKRNRSARTLRAALWRFGQLSHTICPSKGKAYVSNLIPRIVDIVRSPEDSVVDTLSQSLPLILKALGPFMMDNDVKTLLGAFFQNVPSPQAALRRATANMILTTCLNCRKPQVFLHYVLKYLLEVIIAISDDENYTATVIGVFGCLRMILPYIQTSTESEVDEMHELDSLLQIYEVCLHYTKCHSDHNIVNAALETLVQFLQSPPRPVLYVLLSRKGIIYSRIVLNNSPVKLPLGETCTSLATTVSEGNSNSTLNLLEAEVPDINPKIEKWIANTEEVLAVIERVGAEHNSQSNIVETKEQTLENYSDLKIGTVQNEDIEEGSDVGSEIEKSEVASHVSEQVEQLKDEEYANDISLTNTSPKNVISDIPLHNIDVGSFTDPDMSLKFCCRYLISSFLLSGSSGQLMPDKAFRVSVKSLALTCVAYIIKLYPNLLLMPVAKVQTTNENPQMITDILLFANHPDPQIRGNVSIIIGSFLKAVLVQNGGSFKNLEKEGQSFQRTNENVLIEDMIQLLLKGLQDDSATTCRQTLSALSLCLPELLESVDYKYGIAVLNSLPRLVKNPYFLVKVKLVDLLSSLSYTTIEYISGGPGFQNQFIDVIMTLLGEQDRRIRSAASNALVKIIPLLYFQHSQEDAMTRKATQYSEHFLSTVMLSTAELSTTQEKHKLFMNTGIKPFKYLNTLNDLDYHPGVEYSLSCIVNNLTEVLTITSSKFLIYGCSEALSLLSETYATCIYPRGWDCILPKTLLKKSYKKINSRTENSDSHLGSDIISSPVGNSLLSLALSLLTSSPISLDLSTHRHLILLAGNLASGLALCNLKPIEPSSTNDMDVVKLWGMFKDKQMQQHMELLLIHITRVLNSFVHVIDEAQFTQASTKSALPSLPTAQALSPKKKLLSEQKLKERPEKLSGLKFGKEQMGTFITIPHYIKMYENFKAAHANYLVTLDSEASELYLSLLNATLDVLSQIFEIATINEAGRIAEEILYYLQTTVILSPTPSIRCVQQLLKCIFSTNIGAQWNELNLQKAIDHNIASKECIRGFYNQCFQNPARQLADTIKYMGNNCRGESEADVGWVGLLRRKGDRKFSSAFKGLVHSLDQKSSVKSFIRLFEPMVIKSFKQYTITSSISLQCQVLMLLSQLVQLRVNYCMLDTDKVFISFVLKQFEFIEEGCIQQTEDLLPKIFNFLVHLSYDKYHTKAIIGVPKVIQLCDLLVASGQPALTHCIPALTPVVEDLFLMRNISLNANEQRELETTKEVLISMLLRLVEYHEIIELLALCLTESRFSGDGNGEEKWRRWSRQTMDTVLPMLAAKKVRIESIKAHIALVKLFAAISPTVFRPADPLLKVLFATPATLDEPILKLKRWLGMINIILLSLISCAKEEAMLARLSDLNIYTADFSDLLLDSESSCKPRDPLNALGTQSTDGAPERILARFIFKVISLTATKVYNVLGLIDYKSPDPYVGFSEYVRNDDYLIHQFAYFLQLCIHMFESGSHCKVANATMQMIRGRNMADEDKLPIADLNFLMLHIGNICPTITCQWAYLMTLLGYNEMSFWSKILGTRNPDHTMRTYLTATDTKECATSINIQIIRKGGIVLFCDYVCENLNDAEPLTWLLVNHIEEAIHFATESPVKDLLVAAVHRNPAASGLLIQAIATKCVDLSQPSFVKRLLQCIEGAHHSQSGAVILTLIPSFLSTKYLALSRMAAKIASRRAEILLALTAADATEQLLKNDLVKIMETLHSTKLAKKHGSLVSLLNRLAVQYYDLSPLELDPGRSFNPSTIKNIQLDRTWFLSQVKLRCCYPNASCSSLESAQLLSDLNFEDCFSVLSCKDFNIKVLKDCIALGVRLTIEKYQKVKFEQGQTKENYNFEASGLYVAAKKSLLEHVRYIIELIPKPHQLFEPVHYNSNAKAFKYTAKLVELIEDSVYWDTLFMIIPAVRSYVRTLSKLDQQNMSCIDEDFSEDLAKFSVLCFELTHWLVYSDKIKAKKLSPRDVELALSCAADILKQPGPSKVFGDSTHYSWVCSAAATLTQIVEHIVTTNTALPFVNTFALKPAFEDDSTKDYAEACNQMAMLVAWLEKCQVEDYVKNIPVYLFNTVQDLIISISRQPLVNSYILTPPLVWKHGWNAVGTGITKCYFPLLSSESNHLQEVEILEQFIYRVNLLGWTSRLQFEEIWMALLGVLNLSQNENIPSEEIATMIQASSLAVQAITRLLLQTLLLPYPGNPGASMLIHHPRDPQLSVHKVSSQKLYAIQDLLLWKYEYTAGSQNTDGLKLDHIFHRGNIERVTNFNRFTYSQLSISYLWSLCNLHEDKLSASVLDLKNERNNALMSASLDLDSCLRFLVELYTSWLSPQSNTPIQLLTEIIKSILSISELFVERAQYQWMLDVCLDVVKTHPIENEILHQYLVVCVCKAAAVLTPLNFEMLERVKRLVDFNLKSSFLAARISSLHGLLYLLQSAVLADCEETMNIIHPLAIEYIQKHNDTQEPNSVLGQSEEHQSMIWALVFFLLEHVEDTPSDAEAPAVLELVLSLVMSQNISSGLHQTLVQGLERLVATKSVIGKVSEQIVKVAIDRLKQPSPNIALPALQLLLTCMYTEAAERFNQPNAEEPLVDIEPEMLIRSIERTSAIFDRIKKGHPIEVEVLCAVLSGLLGDFFPPSEILTKVIGEFLSPQQPHPRLLAAIVFKVCERACTSTQMGLLQEWVVFSLPNFIQSLPIAMSIWCLSCFFISASTNNWLRALFPYIQSRIGKYEYEDKRVLCIAASDFYHKLSKESQKNAFVETFQAAAVKQGTPFSDILASL